eukprot:TRINITY_DN17734_c0_g1_i1.p1 TRINITY_DN17734_c0_g1~~TRINITY_DN17734_c0_g1_i1.p1  ORF type:complete len:316 (+),score=46.39 TRINITY_DN17734_c0_g1_i1:75-1022(+)
MAEENRSSKSLDADVGRNLKDAKVPLRSKFDGLVLFLHNIMKLLDFRCVGCGDQTDDSADVIAPAGWNSSSDSWSFKYRHPRSTMTFVLKCLQMGDQILVHALAIEVNEVHSLQLNITDWTNSSAALDDYDALFKDTAKLVQTFRSEITNRLLPEDTKHGYGLAKQQTVTSTNSNNSRSNQDRRDPLRDDRYDPLREDPLRVPNSGGRRYIPPPMGFEPFGGGGMPMVPPFGMGHNDLSPFGNPYMGPTFGGSGGNLMGPNHPGFFQGGRGGGIPRGAHPPGARFDPYGPPGMGFPEPDGDEFMPPGSESGFSDF